MTAKSLKKKKKKTVISPDVLFKRQYKKEVLTTFKNAGFASVPSAADKEFTYQGSTTDFDEILVSENIILFVEYTTTKSENLSSHLKPKKIIYDKIIDNAADFIEFYDEKFPDFKTIRGTFYDVSQFIVKILYCSKNVVDTSLKSQVPKLVYFDYPFLKYFKSVTETVKLSARSELFEFLGLTYDEVGKNSLSTSNNFEQYKGSVLPHSFSNFKRGYKVVSFYIDPKSLLDRVYVLRRDGWKDDTGLYQRMISKKKINDIRKYLNTEKRVFINNVIATLPDTTKLVDENSNPIDHNRITKTAPANILIPRGFGVIGLIDGQHRVFAYHEGGLYDDEISKLREKQNLLVTGIIYPSDTSAREKTQFEANLFLEINSTQTSAKSDLTDEIRLLLDPYQAVSIAKSLINKLNESGPLAGQFERFFFDTDKIKTTSIVNYGLKPLVKLAGEDSFYFLWGNRQKTELINKNDDALLLEYIKFCYNELAVFFSAIKQVVNTNLWTADRYVTNRILTTTIINGLIICLRLLIENKHTVFSLDIEKRRLFYVEKLKDIETFDFSTFKSSQYRSMAEHLYDRFLK